jgi:hypothetical protein
MAMSLQSGTTIKKNKQAAHADLKRKKRQAKGTKTNNIKTQDKKNTGKGERTTC